MHERADFPCRLCGGEELTLLYVQGHADQFRYYRCARCKLVNLDLSEGLDQEQYTREDSLADPTDDHDPRNAHLDASFAFVRRFLPEAGSLFDIGCGNGRLLHLAQRAGWAVKGIELSDAAAEKIRQRLGVEVVTCDFLDFEPEPRDLERYDVVSLRHVLEHLPDSRLAMRRMHDLLRPDGCALLEMPNIEALDKRFKRSLTRAGLHKKRYATDFVAGHCNEFCRGSFEVLLEMTGFRLLRWETYSNRPLSNWFFTRVPIGNKARALAQRVR